MFQLRYLVASLLAGFSMIPVLAQYGDLAMAGSSRTARTADVASIQLVPTQVPGVVELTLPAGALGVDVLNARGKVVHELETGSLDRLDLNRLRPGTWTVRVRTADGYLIRRFVVLGRGGMYWSPSDQRAARAH